MRTNVTAFNEKNTSKVKSPRFVIEIDFSEDGTDLHYFTSHSDIPTVTPVTHGVLENTSSISQKLLPERANSTIGSLSFNLVDAGQAVTTIFNSKRITRKVLFGKRTRLYLGYEGMAWADYRLEQTQYIDKKIKYKNAVYFMSCKDPQDRMNKPIMQPLETRLSTALSVADTDVQVYNLTDWQMVERDTDFLDAPSSTCTYLEISDGNNKEYCRVTAIGSSFTVVRGVLGTDAQAWALPANASDEKGPKVKELIFIQMKSLKAAYAAMTGTQIGQTGTWPDHWHAGIDAGLLTEADFSSQDDFTAYSLELKKTDCKKFLESEAMLPNARFFRVNGAGNLDVKKLFAVNEDTSTVFTLDESNITKYGDLEYDSSDTSNKFEINWSYDPLPKKAEYRRKSTFKFADSVTDYGEKVKAFKFRLINGVTATTSTLLNIVNSFADRYAGEAARLKISTFSKNNDLEIGDVVRVKHSGIIDFNTGATIDRAMQIISSRVSQEKGTLDLELFGSTFTPDPLTDGTVRVMADSFYSATGTLIPNITANQLTINTTLVGSADQSASVFYFAGDLTIPAGVTLFITDNAQIRIMGHLTVLGDIDCAGNGNDVGGGFIGTSIGANGSLCYTDSNAAVTCNLNKGGINEGLYEAFPTLPIDNPDGLSLDGIPADLRGSRGATGAASMLFDAALEIIELSAGGTGNSSGSAAVIICRGMSLSGAGAIDVSGVAGGTATADGSSLGGNAGYSTPGGFLILLDGGTSSVPGINGRITALSNDPKDQTALDIRQNAARIQFIPQPRVPIADDVIVDSSVALYTWIKFADDAAGAGISDDPTGKAYLGLATNKTSSTESNTPGDYTWSQILGDTGVPGSDGVDGTTTYTWVKYADDVTGTGLSDSPTGKDYIGLAFNKISATESNTPADYTWSLYVGADGVAGADGADGAIGAQGVAGVDGADALSSLPIPFAPGLSGGAGDFIFTLDMLTGGTVNIGEIRIQGSRFLHPDGTERTLQADSSVNTGFGEGLSGRFFLMWSDTARATRFPTGAWGDSTNIIPIVETSGQWYAIDNAHTQFAITVVATDCILAVVEAETTTSGLTAITPFVSGAAGLDGSPGADGANGLDGSDGATGATGPQGNPGADGIDGGDGSNGTNGNTVAQITIYRRSASAPATPTGGSYNFDTNVIGPPAGWFATPQAGTDPLYSSTAIANIVGTTGTDSSITWGSPNLLVQDGSDGADGASGTAGADGSDGTAGNSVFQATIYRRSASVPSTPAVNSASYDFGTNVLTPPAGWSVSPPAGTEPLYVSQATFEIVGATGSDSTQTWTTPAIFVQDGDDGADGSNGTDGTDGTNGLSTYMYSVYQRAASAPGTPTGGSFNFGTNTGSPPAGWSNSIPAGTDPLYVSQALASISGDTGTDSTLTWSSPVILSQDGTDGLGADPILNSSSGVAPTTMSHTSVGNAITIEWTYRIGANGSSGIGDPVGTATYTLKRGSTTLDTITLGYTFYTSEAGFWSWGANPGAVNTLVDTPGAGTYSYTITVTEDSSDTLDISTGSITSREEQ